MMNTHMDDRRDVVTQTKKANVSIQYTLIALQLLPQPRLATLTHNTSASLKHLLVYMKNIINYSMALKICLTCKTIYVQLLINPMHDFL